MKYTCVVLLLSLLTTTAYAQTPETVDFNGNQIVDLPDFVKFVGAFETDHPKYDLDQSGTVDFGDFLIFAPLFGQTAELQAINFSDPYLEHLIREHVRNIDQSPVVLDVPYLTEPFTPTSTEPILLQDLRELRSIELPFNSSAGSYRSLDLSGLENLTSLQTITLNYYKINDLSPLANLSHLNRLHLGYNQISDLSPLANLTNLSYLFLENNEIQDISPLANLPNLITAELHENQIQDISPLSGHTTLNTLKLSYNQIDDVTSLSTLSNLTTLTLDGNQIVDISPLTFNTGFDTNDLITLIDNPLSETSQNVHIPTLATQGAIIAPLPTESNTSGIVDPILIKNLSQLLDKPETDIAQADLQAIQKLEIQGTTWGGFPNKVVSLIGLEQFETLSYLKITHGFVSDLTPLSNLTTLETLEFENNRITDLTPIINNQTIKSINLTSNALRSLPNMTNMTNLETLSLPVSPVSDISGIAGHPTLKTIILSSTSVTDLTPLLNIPNLERVVIFNNMLNDEALNTQIPQLEANGVRVSR